MKYTKLLLIEDGSIIFRRDMEQAFDSMGIYPITYRQGSTPPQLMDLCQEPESGQTGAIGFSVESKSNDGD